MKTQSELFEVIKQIHFACNHLCKQILGRYFPNSGNIGVFCQSDEEYQSLSKLREELTEPSDTPNQKYYKLREQIVIPQADEVPETTYTHLYIRKPDPTPYGQYIGDVDFIMEPKEYAKLKSALLNGKEIKGAEIYDRPSWDNIQLSDPNSHAVAYISTKEMAEKVRVKFD